MKSSKDGNWISDKSYFKKQIPHSILKFSTLYPDGKKFHENMENHMKQ